MDDFKNNLPESDHAGFAPPQNDATPTSTPTNDTAAASAANPFQQPAPSADAATTPPQPETPPSFSQTPPPFQQPDFSLNGQIVGAKSKKKMKGWKIAVISVVSAVIVLGAGTGIAYAASDTVKNFAKMNFSSESDYYQWVIEKNTKDWGRSVSDRYDSSLSLSKEEPQSNLSMNITLSEEGQKKLQEELNSDVDTDETITLTSAAITLSGKVEADKMGGTVTITLNGEDVLEGNVVADANNVYLQIPSVSDQYLSMTWQDVETITEEETDLSDEFDSSIDSSALNSSSLFLTPEVLEDRISPSDLNSMFQRYGEIIADSDATIALLKNQELNIADTTFSYTALEATYQGDELKTVVKELLEEVKEDRTISHYFAASDLMTEDEFQSNLQEALDNWNDTTVTESATVTLYVDPTGTIRGCRIADPDDANSSLLECYAGKDGKQVGVYFDVSGLNVSGVLSEGSKDTYSGTITAALENHSILLDLEDFKIVDDKRGYCSGSLTASTEDEPNLFTLSLDSDGKSQTFSVDWAVGGTNYATISCTLSTENGDDLALNIPSDSLDLSDDATKDAYFGDGTQTKDCLKKIATALGIQDADNFADSIYDEINGGDDLNTQSSDSDITTLPADSDRPVEDGVETEVPTDTTDTTDSSDNEQRIDADLSIAAITYNGGKLFRFYENNMDLIQLVDCTVSPTIESQNYNWYSNSDDTLTLGLENTSTSPTDAQACNIFEVEVYEGSPSDIRVGVVGIGSSVADLEAQFNIDIVPEAETASIYVVSIYDTVSNGQKAYSFYIENGKITAFDLVDYS